MSGRHFKDHILYKKSIEFEKKKIIRFLNHKPNSKIKKPFIYFHSRNVKLKDTLKNNIIFQLRNDIIPIYITLPLIYENYLNNYEKIIKVVTKLLDTFESKWYIDNFYIYCEEDLYFYNYMDTISNKERNFDKEYFNNPNIITDHWFKYIFKLLYINAELCKNFENSKFFIIYDQITYFLNFIYHLIETQLPFNIPTDKFPSIQQKNIYKKYIEIIYDFRYLSSLLFYKNYCHNNILNNYKKNLDLSNI